MRPIYRIPQHDYSKPLASVVMDEYDAVGRLDGDTAAALTDAVDHDDEHLEFMLDWAMQIRMETGLRWDICIRVASVFYYG